MPVATQNRLPRDVFMKDRGPEDRLKHLEIELDNLKTVLKRAITTTSAMRVDIENKRLASHKRMSGRIDLIDSFIREKLAPGEFERFNQHRRGNRGFPRDEDHTQRTTDPSAVVADEFSPSALASLDTRGGKRRTRKKKTRKSKKKSRRKYK